MALWSKPCARCGGQKEIYHNDDPEDEHLTTSREVCPDCQEQGEPTGMKYPGLSKWLFHTVGVQRFPKSEAEQVVWLKNWFIKAYAPGAFVCFGNGYCELGNARRGLIVKESDLFTALEAALGKADA